MSLTRTEVDNLWTKHVGSRKLFMSQEIAILKKLLKEKVLPWGVVYQLYLTSKKWRMTRSKVLRRDGACVMCSSVLFLQVDHKKYTEFGKEKLEDLQLLCYRCHAVKTKKYDLLANKVVPTKVIRIGDGQELFSLLRVKHGR